MAGSPRFSPSTPGTRTWPQLQRGASWSSWITELSRDCRQLSEKFLALGESARCISITLKIDVLVSNVERLNQAIFEVEVSQQ